MSIIIDPEGKEIAALRRLAHWGGVRVLEFGCGDGRLTLRLASLGAHVGVRPQALAHSQCTAQSSKAICKANQVFHRFGRKARVSCRIPGSGRLRLVTLMN